MEGLSASIVSVLIKILSDTKGIEEAKLQMSSFEETSKKAASVATGALVAAGVAIATASTYSLKAASDFQKQMMLIQTNAGASAAEVQNMSKAILDMAASVGTSPDELATGLYHIESAGFRGAQALNMLRAAAEGAKNGNADLESVTQAMISVTASHIKGVKDETDAMGILNAIVGSGDMKMQGLAQAMSTGIMPSAAAFGLSIKDVGASLATLTDNAVPPIDAATRLRMLFSMMGAPSQAAAKAFESVGLKSTQLADDMRNKGLFSALQDLQKHLKDAGLTASQQQDVIARAFGGGRESATILTLLDQMDRLKSKYGDIAEGASKFGDSWAATQQTASFATARLNAGLQSLAIQYGQILLPVYTNVVNYIAANFIPAIQNLGTWWKEHQKQITANVNAIEKGLIPMFQFTWFVIQMTFIPVMNQLNQIWQQHHKQITLLAEAVGFVLVLALNGLIMVLGAVIQVILKVVQDLLDFGSWVVKTGKQVVDVANTIGLGWQAFGKIFMDVIDTISLGWKTFVNGVVDGVNKIIQGIDAIGKAGGKGGLNIPTLPHFASGVTNFTGGWAMLGENGPELAYLPTGSNVYTHSQSQQILNQGGSGVTINQTNNITNPNPAQTILNNINYALSALR